MPMEVDLEQILRDKNLKDKVVVAIDGKCGSGKTTLAEELKNKFDLSVVHMDDFYLPFQKRSKNWMNEIGGHMDFDRLIESVLVPYKNHKETDYISYDCHNDKYLQKIDIDLDKPLVIEGAYSCYPKIVSFVDYKIYIDIDDDRQYERLKNRNAKAVDKFLSMWIPFENKYFDTFKIKENADLLINL